MFKLDTTVEEQTCAPTYELPPLTSRRRHAGYFGTVKYIGVLRPFGTVRKKKRSSVSLAFRLSDIRLRFTDKYTQNKGLFRAWSCYPYSHLQECIYSYSHLQECIYSYSRLQECIYSYSHLQECIYSYSHLQECIYSYSHLQECIYSYSHLQECIYSYCHRRQGVRLLGRSHCSKSVSRLHSSVTEVQTNL